MQYKDDPPDISNLKITMFEVKSSNIKKIGYDKKTLTLRVVFKSSPRAYDYKEVPDELYQEFMSSDSMGRFFFARIKSKFEFDKN